MAHNIMNPERSCVASLILQNKQGIDFNYAETWINEINCTLHVFATTQNLRDRCEKRQCSFQVVKLRERGKRKTTDALMMLLNARNKIKTQRSAGATHATHFLRQLTMYPSIALPDSTDSFDYDPKYSG